MLTQRLATAWRVHRDRVEHDRALLDPRIAAEHLVADTRATSHGEAGCPFCHS
jgi:hypothetical protein